MNAEFEKTIEKQVFGNEQASTMNFPTSDGEIIFRNCVFKNISLNFETSLVVFKSCEFDGDVQIHNIGIGDIDKMVILQSFTNPNAISLKASSSDLVLKSSAVDSEIGMELVAVTALIEQSKINARLAITYYDDLKVQDSELAKLAKIEFVSSPEGSFTAFNSNINGIALDGTVPVSTINTRQLQR